MSITNKLNQIKNAIYGKEVRGAIHDAIKQVYDDASVNNDNANMEVKMARGTHNTLNDRLDNVDVIQAQTNAQLSVKINKNEGGVITHAMLSQEVREEMTGGSVAVVGVDSILNEHVVDGSITAKKTNFLYEVVGNMFDTTSVTIGYYVNNATGDLLQNDGYVASDFIEIEQNIPYYNSDPRLSAWYDKNKKYISGLTNGYSNPTVPPSNARYIRITFAESNYKRQYFGKNSNYVNSNGKQNVLYGTQKFNDMIERLSPNKKTLSDIYGFKTNFINLVNPYLIKTNTMIDPYTGFEVESLNNFVSGFIEIEGSEKYTCTVARPIAFYDENKKYILGYNGGGGWTSPITSPANAKYVRVTLSSASDVFCKGETLLSSNGYGHGNIVIDEELRKSIYEALKIDIAIDNIPSKLQGKKINVLGDSITSVDYTTPNWWQQIASETGAIFNNYGISGTCIAHNEERETNFGQCFAKRYTLMDEDADIVFVMGGTNDNYINRLGEWNSDDITTLYGALNILMRGLKEIYDSKTILFATPIQRMDSFKSSDYRQNPTTFLDSQPASSILPVQIIAEVIKRKCNQYGIKCLDLFNESGINGYTENDYRYSSDGWDIFHPSEQGQLKLKVAIKNFMETSI